MTDKKQEQGLARSLRKNLLRRKKHSRPLCLVAHHTEDLQVLSSYLHGAKLSPSDCLWERKKNRFILTPIRYHREEGTILGVHFDWVRSVSFYGISQQEKLVLATMTFHASHLPLGHVVFVFNTAASIVLEVEALEVHCKELISS